MLVILTPVEQLEKGVDETNLEHGKNLRRSQVNPTPELTIPDVYFKSSASDLYNNNRNYDSKSATRFALALCFEDEFGNPIGFRLLLVDCIAFQHGF